MIELPNRTTFAFKLSIPDCKIGKEGLYQTLISLMEKQRIKGWVFNWNSQEFVDGMIIMKCSGMPFANLSYNIVLSIDDNTIKFEYEEMTDQEVMLPNISQFVLLLMLSMKTVERIDGDAKCEIEVDNNANAYFYEKYSILEVDYSRLLKYGINHNVSFEVVVKSKDDVYILFNRFYQQFKAPESMEKPFVTVVKDDFMKIYDAL